ncbi:MAG: D-alanyl-D-alanine carboxypeptidase [Clostridia bacterium]|nr:D-alanyl-D-alanine carboxypeptidase [Clostridia bacterium]
MKKFISIFIIEVLILFYSTFCYADNSIYTWNSRANQALAVSSNITEEYTNDTSNPLNLDCESAILIEQKTGKVLYSYNVHEKLRPASVTKIMSILLIMEAINSGKINYDTKIPCSENAASMGGSQIWLDTTETLTVEEMLKAICVVSANDCVTAMAEYLGGTEDGFIKMMNEKAKELGMNDTEFKNCHGIDEDGHMTSSNDISLMSKELLTKYPEITKYTTIWNDSLRDGKSELVNTNKLVRNYNGCTGLKTGSTSQALFNLSASATRDGLSLIAVVMKAPTSAKRFKCASSLLDFGFANFEYKKMISKDDVIKNVKVEKGVITEINAIAEKDCGTLITKGNDFNIEQSIELSDSIKAPIKKGDVIGKIKYSYNGEIVDECDLTASDDVAKMNIISMEQYVLDRWFTLLR